MPSPLKPKPKVQRTPSPLPGAQPIVIHPTPLEQGLIPGVTPTTYGAQPVTNAVTSLQHALGFTLPAYLARAQDAAGRIVRTVARG